MKPRRLCAGTSSESGVSAKGQKRVALVIGNNEYKEAPLKNPAHDAEDIANVLRGLGFTVQTKINADQRGMEEAVKEFVREIQNGDVGLFYFSGHGVQVHGENYLMPVGGSITTEADVKYKAVSAGYILAQMDDSRNRTNIFILDACRNNPFKGFRSMSKGLTMMDAPVGTFIAYATAPGSVAADGTDRNSPYAKHLMQAMKSKDIKIEDVFKEVLREVRKETEGKQIPWIASSLQEDFYFNPSLPTSLQETSPPSQTPASAQPEVKRGILGINVQDLNESQATSFGKPDTNGALTQGVLSGTPAEKAGIKAGDIIVEFNDQPITGATQLKNIIRSTEPGRLAKLKVFRDKKLFDVDITIGKSPDSIEVLGQGRLVLLWTWCS